MPAFQGKHDGLCGVYAILNAFEFLGMKADSKDLFRRCCSVVTAKRLPELIATGAHPFELTRMIKACAEVVPAISASYPFRSPRTPASDAVYWREVDRIFNRADDARFCAIIGLRRPDHWIVMSGLDQSFAEFIDSSRDQPLKRKRRRSLFAGERNASPNKWLINRDEFILLEAS